METINEAWQEFKNDCVREGIDAKLLSRIEFAFRNGYLSGATRTSGDPLDIISEHMKLVQRIYAEKPTHIADTFLLI